MIHLEYTRIANATMMSSIGFDASTFIAITYFGVLCSRNQRQMLGLFFEYFSRGLLVMCQLHLIQLGVEHVKLQKN